METAVLSRGLARPILLLALALGLTAACEDDEGDVGGGPVAPARADGSADAADARPDRPVAEAGDGPADAGHAAADSAPRKTTSGGGLACDTCEASHCAADDRVARCVQMLGNAAAGPRKDAARADLCLAVLACVRGSGCAAANPEACYCGAGISATDCGAGRAGGVCKAAIEAAAESTDAAEVRARLFNPLFAVGNAFALLDCDRTHCATECRIKGGPATPRCPTAGSSTLPCIDLDDNCVPDCHETLVTNPGFAVDLAGWKPEAGLVLGWDPRDAEDKRPSGALAFSNSRMAAATAATMAGARQCLPLSRPGSHQIAAQVFIPPGQIPGSAGVAAELYPSADCSGAPAHSPPAILAGRSDAWLTVAGRIDAPASARSLSLRLVISKSLQSPPLRALFDNVLVAPR